MKNYLFIMFATMLVFCVGYKSILLYAYSTIDEARQFKNFLKRKGNSWLALSIATVTICGGLRLVLGLAGVCGLTFTIVGY